MHPASDINTAIATLPRVGIPPQFIQWPVLAYLEALYPGQAVLSVKQTAAACGWSPKTVANQIHEGKCPIQNTGSRYRPAFRKVDVAAFLELRPVGRPKGSTKAKRIEAQQTVQK